MLSIEHWSKQRVHDVMQELLFSTNYWLFLVRSWVKQHCPGKVQAEEFERYQAKRL